MAHMLRCLILMLVFLPLNVFGQSACPTVPFLTARTVNLKPSTISHIDVVRQQDGSYTGFEVTDAAPYRTLATTPHFERQLAACLPHTFPSAPSPTMPVTNPVGAAAQSQVSFPIPSGNYFAASLTDRQSPSIRFDVFDAKHNLLSENNFSYSAPTQSSISVRADYFFALTLADMNGDGNFDLIALFNTNRIDGGTEGGVWIFLGHGDGTFDPGKRFALLAIGAINTLAATNLASADVNGDGKPDVLLTTNESGSYPTLAIALGNGDGTVNPKTITAGNILPTGPLPSVFTLADLNGDHRADLIISGYTATNSPVVLVALGNGDGTFQSLSTYPVSFPLSSTTPVAVGDLNGDGFPDIVSIGGTILFGDGKGGFPSQKDYPLNTAGSIMLADFDGDGKTDILIGNGSPAFLTGGTQNSEVPNNSVLTVLFGEGNGLFTGAAISRISLAQNPSLLLASADFTRDGIPDLVVADYSDNTLHLSLLQSQKVGQLSPVHTQSFPHPSGYIPTFVTAADFNLDGRPDLAVLLVSNQNQDQVEIYPGLGDGTFGSPATLVLAASDTSFNFLAAPDVNGDGIPDLAVTGDKSVTVSLGKGDGVFSSPTFTMSASYPAVVFGDFNRDGKLDLAMASLGDTNISVLLGKGDGTFPALIRSKLPAGAVGFRQGLVAGDFDGDGLLDLELGVGAVPVGTPAQGGTAAIVVLSGTGTGSFGSAHLSPGVFTSAVTIDINGDKKPDLIGYLNEDGSNNLVIYLGNGDGTFQSKTLLPNSGPFVVTDLNHDGLPDVAEVTRQGIATFLQVAQPSSAFSVVSAASFTPGALAPGSIATVFGNNLALAIATASNSLMTLLGGVTVTVLDSNGASWPAPLFFVSPQQVNFLVPAGASIGSATIVIANGQSGTTLQTLVEINAFSPTLFSAGSGFAAAYVVQIALDGTQTTIPTSTVQSGSLVPTAIDLTKPGQTFLILFGTGFDAGDIGSSGARVQGLGVPITYVGPQQAYAGLDQMNLLLPSSLPSGIASVTVWTGGKQSNTVFITIR